jgi:hypothetical protein
MLFAFPFLLISLAARASLRLALARFLLCLPSLLYFDAPAPTAHPHDGGEQRVVSERIDALAARRFEYNALAGPGTTWAWGIVNRTGNSDPASTSSSCIST